MTRAFDSDDKAKGFSVYRTHALLLITHALIGFVVYVLLSRLIVIDELPKGFAVLPLFVTGAFVFAAQYLYMNGWVYFNATRQFKFISIANGVQFLTSGLLALGLTLIYRTPEAYLAGFATGYFGVYLYAVLRGIAQSREAQDAVWFDKEAFRYGLGFGARLYLTKIGAVAIGTFDRGLMTDMLGPAKLTHYTNATRYSEVVGEALPINQTLLPDLTKAHMEGDKKFAELVDRGSRIAFMVGCGVVLLPSAFGAPALQLWLQDKYVPEMAFVMLCMGAFRAFEAFYGSLVQAMFAHNSPLRVTLQTIVTAMLLVVFAYPAIKYWGISGAAALRVFVHAFLFFPIAWYVWKTVVPEISFGVWIGKLLGTLAIAVGFSAFGYWLCALPTMGGRPWLPLLFLPFVMVLFFVIVDKTGLAPVPDTIKNKLQRMLKREVSA